MQSNAPRLLIAGTNSGCGKTTVVCALLQALKNRSYAPVSFKCGPDYIDPMFHTEILGLDSRNLDLFFSGEAGVRQSFADHAGQLNLIEGVMGFYDGISMEQETASSYHLAKVLNAPAVLVVNARGMALSAAALVRGYMQLRQPNPVRGVILNRVSPMSYPKLKAVIERECGVPVYGFLPAAPECALESRHLGLVTAQEVDGLREKMQRLAQLAEAHLDLDGLIALMQVQPPVERTAQQITPLGNVRIAVARDKAFCFYYKANLELLEALGAQLVAFSPLTDSALPDCDGLLLGGGYPELYIRELSENTAMRDAVRQAVESGLPTIAECGGFMYLCREMAGVPMVGVIDTACRNTEKLGRFGYVTLTAQTESLLFAPGEQIPAHEFHYWDAADPGAALAAQKPNGRQWRCAHVSETLYAGYPHMYLASAPQAAARFVRKCLERKERKQ